MVVDSHHGSQTNIWFETVFHRPGRLEFKKFDKSVDNEVEKTVLNISNGKARVRFPKSKKEQNLCNDLPKSAPWLNRTLAKYADQSNEWLMAHESKEQTVEFGLWAGGIIGITSVIYDLLYQDRPNLWIDSSKIHLLSDKIVDRTDCYHLWCIDKSLQVWIAKNSLLIKKIHFDNSSSWDNEFQQKFSGSLLKYMGSHLRKHSPEFVNGIKSVINDSGIYKICSLHQVEIRN